MLMETYLALDTDAILTTVLNTVVFLALGIVLGVVLYRVHKKTAQKQ